MKGEGRFAFMLFSAALLLLVCAGAVAAEDVVCFGDSATEGAVDMTFPDYLEGFIVPGDGQVVNEGKSGETTDDGYWRIFWLVATFRYAGASVWTYWEGGNDVIDWVEANDPYMLYDPSSPTYPLRAQLDTKLANIKSNIKRSVDLIRTTGAEVVLGTYVGLVPWLPCDPSPIGFMTPGMIAKANHYMDELNGVIRQVASEENAPLNDMQAEIGWMADHIISYHDCIHSNAIGNFFIAITWWAAVTPYLN